MEKTDMADALKEKAGIPFPPPRTGWEAACNYEFNNHGDAACYQRHAPNINPMKGETCNAVKEL